jgi:hypothetical protein
MLQISRAGLRLLQRALTRLEGVPADGRHTLELLVVI